MPAGHFGVKHGTSLSTTTQLLHWRRPPGSLPGSSCTCFACKRHLFGPEPAPLILRLHKRDVFCRAKSYGWLTGCRLAHLEGCRVALSFAPNASDITEFDGLSNFSFVSQTSGRSTSVTFRCDIAKRSVLAYCLELLGKYMRFPDCSTFSIHSSPSLRFLGLAGTRGLAKH